MHLPCILVVDGDKVDEAVLREVRHMAKSTGMYEHRLDEIFVLPQSHNSVTNDNSIQLALVGHGLLAGFSAAGSGESKVIRQRAATLGILLNGFVKGLIEKAPILEELGHHLTAFLEVSACVESDGVLSTHRGTGASISSDKSRCSTHRLLPEPGTITPSYKRASASSIGPAVVAGGSSSSSRIHQPQEPGLPASISVFRRRGRPSSQQPGRQWEYWDLFSTLQDFHTICMIQLRETKERLAFQEDKHIELIAKLNDC
jgi:hypothetical protein